MIEGPASWPCEETLNADRGAFATTPQVPGAICGVKPRAATNPRLLKTAVPAARS